MPNLLKYSNKLGPKLARYKKFTELVGLKSSHTVLDVGSGHGFSFENFNAENEVVGLDLEPATTIKRDKFTYVQGDGSNMYMFKDRQFDFTICVGVFEHIRPDETLRKMANEIMRVSKGYAIIIPDLLTIIEPHYQLPFWQFYPSYLKKFLAKNLDMGIYYKNPNGDYEDLIFHTIKEWKNIFPNAKFCRYNHIRFGPFGIIKNTIIYKPIV